MPNSRFYDRRGRSQLSADQGQTVLVNSSGVGSHGFVVPGAENVADDLSSILAQFKAVYELGRLGMAQAISADASVEDELVVPAGKYWRLIGAHLNYTASADVATRTPIITVEQTDDTALDTITLTTKAASDVENDSVLFGSDGNVTGSAAVASQATLTIAEQITAGDTMTIAGVTYTFIANGAAATVANSISIGANEAAAKVNIETVLQDGVHPTVNAPAVFSTDDLVLEARNPGVAGESLACTETFTHANNVFDAATFGTTQTGVDPATKLGGDNYPTNGALLVPTDKVVLNVTNGHANDAYQFNVFYLEFDNDPRN